MIQPSRIHCLNAQKSVGGRYVLYWMQASQRTRCNHALEYAIGEANTLGLPVHVCFGLMEDYPEASERHYAFMLRGLRDVAANLKKRGIHFIIRRGDPPEVALQCAERAAMLSCDRGYLRHQRRWRDRVADEAACGVTQVESDVVCPVEEVSDKAEFAARTIRPKIHRIWKQYLVPLRERKPKHPAARAPFASEIDLGDIRAALAKLKIDRSVPPSKRFEGGETAAATLLRTFIRQRLSGYAVNRNEPADDATSHLSAYLHFGQISPLQIALEVIEAKGAPALDRDALLEELVVRRELAMNYVQFKADYDSFDALPAWAKQTMAKHEKDKRTQIYSREELETARTHDPWWKAGQRGMTATGFMHNYMRMYWGKKILEWKAVPREAFADTLYLNNKYFLCGRDPNAFANVGWIYGLHDRPWGEREIFGTIRYMNAAGLERKFDIKAYAEKW